MPRIFISAARYQPERNTLEPTVSPSLRTRWRRRCHKAACSLSGTRRSSNPCMNTSTTSDSSESFSYPILGVPRVGGAAAGRRWRTNLDEAVERAESFRDAVRGLPGVTCLGHEEKRKAGFRDFDQLESRWMCLGGASQASEFECHLNREWIYPEMATLQHLLFLITPGTSDSDLRRLLHALEKIRPRSPARSYCHACAASSTNDGGDSSRCEVFAQAFVPEREAVGQVSGETVATYPPGAPIIAAGEVVTSEAIDYLRCLKLSGAALRGASDPSFERLKILSS